MLAGAEELSARPDAPADAAPSAALPPLPRPPGRGRVAARCRWSAGPDRARWRRRPSPARAGSRQQARRSTGRDARRPRTGRRPRADLLDSSPVPPARPAPTRPSRLRDYRSDRPRRGANAGHRDLPAPPRSDRQRGDQQEPRAWKSSELLRDRGSVNGVSPEVEVRANSLLVVGLGLGLGPGAVSRSRRRSRCGLVLVGLIGPERESQARERIGVGDGSGPSGSGLRVEEFEQRVGRGRRRPGHGQRLGLGLVPFYARSALVCSNDTRPGPARGQPPGP